MYGAASAKRCDNSPAREIYVTPFKSTPFPQLFEPILLDYLEFDIRKITAKIIDTPFLDPTHAVQIGYVVRFGFDGSGGHVECPLESFALVGVKVTQVIERADIFRKFIEHLLQPLLGLEKLFLDDANIGEYELCIAEDVA